MRVLERGPGCADAFPAPAGKRARPKDQRGRGQPPALSAERYRASAFSASRVDTPARAHTTRRDEISQVRRLFIRGEFEVSRMMWPNAARGGDFCL